MIEEFRGDALAVFHDRPVFAFCFSDPDDLIPGDVPDDVEAWAWRVGVDEYDGPSGDEIFPLFLETVDTTRIKALILGCWHGDVSGEGVDEFQQALLDAAHRFPALEALFISDVPQDMAEISWIEQHDPKALLAAFPGLRVLGMRGRMVDQIESFVHERIEELVLQSGGLAPGVVRALGHSKLPALTSLDLYLGVLEYGGGATVEDLSPVLSGEVFPKLRHLGLRDADNVDELAAALAHAPVVAGLETVDLSLGILTDAGAASLLAGQPLTHLKRLDLHHHYLSEEMIDRLWRALPEVDVDVSEELVDGGGENEDNRSSRYVAVSE